MAGNTETQQALFAAVKDEVAEVQRSGAGVAARAGALRDLALAYRYLAGGQQPGGVTLEKS